MNKNYLLLFSLLFFSFLKAQVSQVYFADSAMQDLDFQGDVLYFVTQGQIGVVSGKIGKIENFDTAPQVTIISNNLGLYPRAIEVVNNIIYFSNASKLRKIDLNQASPIPEDILNANSVRAIHFRDNILYLAENDKISKVDLSVANPIKVNLFTGLEYSPLSFSAYNNELYVAHGYKISKFNMDDINPVIEDVLVGLSGRSYGIDFYENELYIEQTRDSGSGDIIKININETPLNIVDTGVNIPNTILGLNFYNEDIYACRAVNRDIIKIDGLNLSVNEIFIDNLKVQLFPNPTTNYITLSNQNAKEQYSIVDIYGKIVQLGTLLPNNPLNIEFLANGMYILKIGYKDEFKFIKN